MIALAIGLASPLAQADNLADIQKLMKNGYPQALEKPTPISPASRGMHRDAS